jgi:hypothetical protein
MAKKIKLDLSQFKASGVYTLEFDASENVILTSQTIRLVVGFSNKGPFNAPVYLPDVTTAVAVFGEIDKTLEAKGSYFHRSIFACLNTGPVFALNLLSLNDNVDSPTADVVNYFGYSIDTEQSNGVLTSRLYSSFYNKERFWFADTNYFLATLSAVDTGRLFNLVNLGKEALSVIVRKSTDANPPLQGFDVFALDWYGADNVPSFMHPYDYISDYFIDVISVSGDWTDYETLSLDPKWSSYFTRNGFIKSQINNFLSQPDVNILTSTTGCLIPDFVDLNGNNQYIQTLINNNTPSTGLFCAVDEDAMDDICTNPYKIDLVGHHLIDELTADRDIVDARLNFLSYDQNLTADYLYTKNTNTLVDNATGPSGSTPDSIRTGSLFSYYSATGATAGVEASEFDAYDSSLKYGGLHYLVTKGGTAGTLTSTQKTELREFATPSGTSSPYILGKVTGLSGLTGSLINQFSEGDLVKLRIAGITQTSGNLLFTWTHPLDTTSYAAQGVSVVPYSDMVGATASPYIGATGYYQFVASDFLDITQVNPATGGTAGTPNNVLTGQLSTNFYQDLLYGELEDGDQIWLNDTGSSVNYLSYQSTVDRDQYQVSYARTFNNVSRQSPDQLTNYPAFGTVYASDNIGAPVSSDRTDIISSVGSINQFISVVTQIDPTNFTISSTPSSPISVGDLVVSTDLDICETVGSNRQNRLTKVTAVAQTTTANVVQVTTARPVYYYAGSPIQVQKFKSIPQFTRSFDFTYLQGFTMRDSHRPNGTDARVSELLDVMYNTNIAATLAAKDVISFRYIVDTFSGQILPNSKYQLSKLAMMRQKALALINAPSMSQFRASTDPRFTDAPTQTNPYPSLKAQYIAEGGNLSLNPSYTFSLPTEDQGAKYAAFYTPYLTLRENNRNINVPPAAYISNNFVRKFANGEPYSIIAGQKRGVISGQNLVGLEYDFTDTDRGWLEPVGLNPIIKKRGLGVVVFGNQTAYQTVNSAFNLVHVRDLLISVENDVEEIMANYLFDFNEDSIRLEIKTLVDNYLDGVRAGGGIYAYQVIMDSSNNPPSIIDQNIGIIDVIIEPARGIQKFINRITVTRTGGIAAGGFIQFA